MYGILSLHAMVSLANLANNATISFIDEPSELTEL